VNSPVSGEGAYYNHSPLTKIIINNSHGVYIGTYEVELEKLLAFIQKGDRVDEDVSERDSGQERSIPSGVHTDIDR